MSIPAMSVGARLILIGHAGTAEVGAELVAFNDVDVVVVKPVTEHPVIVLEHVVEQDCVVVFRPRTVV